MKVVVACDSFKGCLPAAAVCQAIGRGLTSARSDIDLVLLPLADGGEGTAAAVLESLAGQWETMDVMGPLPHLTVEAGLATFRHPDRTLVEMASASGLELLREDQRDPMRTTSYGTGQLLKAAWARGTPTLLAVGGSATVDGGVGAAMALGWRFLDVKGRDVGFGGAALSRIAKIEPPAAAAHPPLTVLTDVDHVLCGPDGAARVFGPQKGLRAEDLPVIEAGLENLARLIAQQLGVEVAQLTSGGAAGGMAAGAVAFFDATLCSGSAWVREAVGLRATITDADWVITGEGRLDVASLRGKVISGVLEDARATGTRAAAIAGSIRLSDVQLRQAGLSAAYSLTGPEISEAQAIERAADLVADCAARFAHERL